ncbi:MAG: hypothetical protein WCC80_09810, partial [Pseudolabrys sp.]
MNFQILISRNALDNSAFFYEQFKVIWLLGVFGVAVEVSCEIDASCRHPVALYAPWKGDRLSYFPFFKNDITWAIFFPFTNANGSQMR